MSNEKRKARNACPPEGGTGSARHQAGHYKAADGNHQPPGLIPIKNLL
ncbi:hypothetical protein [Pseudomonas sp. PA27(2017)]|nr:hypothetical protein [Pseudomonas sp. PA27(2017)]